MSSLRSSFTAAAASPRRCASSALVSASSRCCSASACCSSASSRAFGASASICAPTRSSTLRLAALRWFAAVAARVRLRSACLLGLGASVAPPAGLASVRRRCACSPRSRRGHCAPSVRSSARLAQRGSRPALVVGGAAPPRVLAELDVAGDRAGNERAVASARSTASLARTGPGAREQPDRRVDGEPGKPQRCRDCGSRNRANVHDCSSGSMRSARASCSRASRSSASRLGRLDLRSPRPVARRARPRRAPSPGRLRRGPARALLLLAVFCSAAGALPRYAAPAVARRPRSRGARARSPSRPAPGAAAPRHRPAVLPPPPRGPRARHQTGAFWSRPSRASSSWPVAEPTISFTLPTTLPAMPPTVRSWSLLLCHYALSPQTALSSVGYASGDAAFLPPGRCWTPQETGCYRIRWRS